MTALKKQILLSVGLFALIAVLFLSFITTTGGYKLIKFGLYLNSLGNNSKEKQTVIQEFSGTKTENEISGFLAGFDGQRIWLWTLKGPMPFLISEVTPAFYFFDTCRDDILYSVDKSKAPSVESKLVFSVKDWLKLAKTGNYIQMSYFYSDKHGKTKLVDKAWASSGDIFIVETARKQCSNL
jgi:hypothetical protein